MEPDSTVIVTGSAGSIGGALVRAFSDEGFHVIGIDRTATPEADESIQLDLAEFATDDSTTHWLRLKLELALDNRQLYVLCNNAAVQQLGPVDALTVADFRSSLDVNLVAPFALSKLCLPWIEACGGAIINIGSIHARLTKPNFTAYATSKGGLEALTRSMAVELGGRIRVNGISPAAVDTPMLRSGFDGESKEYDVLAGCHPAGRIATPHEIAELALFLAGNRATFINGAIVDINGGIGGRLHDPV